MRLRPVCPWQLTSGLLGKNVHPVGPFSVISTDAFFHNRGELESRPEEKVYNVCR